MGEGFSNQESIPVYSTHMASCHSLDCLIMAYTDYAWSTLTESFVCVYSEGFCGGCVYTSVHCMYIVHFSLQVHHRVGPGQ